MTKSMLIYEKVVPLNKQRHSSWGIQSDGTFAFAKDVNSVPLTGVEFAAATNEFSVVFSKTAEGAMPIAILGVRKGENLFVDDQGRWLAKYVPAFIRRYPFVFSTADQGETLTLCLDEAYPGCKADGTGEKLFNSDGGNTEYLDKVIAFLRDYQEHYQRTLWFGKKLEELDLLEPMGAQFNTPDGQKGSLSGFFVISREKLKKLTDAQLAELVKNDALELIYLHLNSMQNLKDTIRRLPETAPA